MESFDVLGLMSGTSLDGLDIAHCKFYFDNQWHYQLIHFDTIPYSINMQNQLTNLENESAYNYALNHVELGKLFGNETNKFIKRHGIQNIDLIASHGHTIFHQPHNSLTAQIGCGAQIAAITGVKTVCDFRTKDVALGGQGAPLVPIGDELLFPEYDYCLNLGGIANISLKKNGKRISFDLGMANMVSNYLCNLDGKKYDEGGNIADSGKLDQKLYEELNTIPFFNQLPPKSLGKEDFTAVFKPILEKYEISINDKLNTFGTHLAFQISKIIENFSEKKILITGGGAFNDFWVSELKKLTSTQIVIPKKEIIEYKEAIIFAFLGVLRIKQQTNCLASVTGAKENTIGGAIYL